MPQDHEQRITKIESDHRDLRLLRLPQVLSIIPVSKTTWYDGIEAGIYPKGIVLNPKKDKEVKHKFVAWRERDIRNLIDQLEAGTIFGKKAAI